MRASQQHLPRPKPLPAARPMSGQKPLTTANSLFPHEEGDTLAVPPREVIPKSRTITAQLIHAVRVSPLRPQSAFMLGAGGVSAHLLLDRLYGSTSAGHTALTIDLWVFSVWIAAIGLLHVLNHGLAIGTKLIVGCCAAFLAVRHASDRLFVSWRTPAQIPDAPCVCTSGKPFKSCCGKM
jgi:hypothetical protein